MRTSRWRLLVFFCLTVQKCVVENVAGQDTGGYGLHQVIVEHQVTVPYVADSSQTSLTNHVSPVLGTQAQHSPVQNQNVEVLKVGFAQSLPSVHTDVPLLSSTPNVNVEQQQIILPSSSRSSSAYVLAPQQADNSDVVTHQYATTSDAISQQQSLQQASASESIMTVVATPQHLTVEEPVGSPAHVTQLVTHLPKASPVANVPQPKTVLTFSPVSVSQTPDVVSSTQKSSISVTPPATIIPTEIHQQRSGLQSAVNTGSTPVTVQVGATQPLPSASESLVVTSYDSDVLAPQSAPLGFSAGNAEAVSRTAINVNAVEPVTISEIVQSSSTPNINTAHPQSSVLNKAKTQPVFAQAPLTFSANVQQPQLNGPNEGLQQRLSNQNSNTALSFSASNNGETLHQISEEVVVSQPVTVQTLLPSTPAHSRVITETVTEPASNVVMANQNTVGRYRVSNDTTTRLETSVEDTQSAVTVQVDDDFAEEEITQVKPSALNQETHYVQLLEAQQPSPGVENIVLPLSVAVPNQHSTTPSQPSVQYTVDTAEAIPVKATIKAAKSSAWTPQPNTPFLSVALQQNNPIIVPKKTASVVITTPETATIRPYTSTVVPSPVAITANPVSSFSAALPTERLTQIDESNVFELKEASYALKPLSGRSSNVVLAYTTTTVAPTISVSEQFVAVPLTTHYEEVQKVAVAETSATGASLSEAPLDVRPSVSPLSGNTITVLTPKQKSSLSNVNPAVVVSSLHPLATGDPETKNPATVVSITPQNNFGTHVSFTTPQTEQEKTTQTSPFQNTGLASSAQDAINANVYQALAPAAQRVNNPDAKPGGPQLVVTLPQGVPTTVQSGSNQQQQQNTKVLTLKSNNVDSSSVPPKKSVNNVSEQNALRLKQAGLTDEVLSRIPSVKRISHTTIEYNASNDNETQGHGTPEETVSVARQHSEATNRVEGSSNVLQEFGEQLADTTVKTTTYTNAPSEQLIATLPGNVVQVALPSVASQNSNMQHYNSALPFQKNFVSAINQPSSATPYIAKKNRVN